ncbi:MAG: UbiA family prenyltransferase [Syntrophaceae bacterium]|nr:UbiA family prenyltransferase [Syntrophaceae bacterium]
MSRLKLFLALSRTPHGLLDLAAPGLSALLWLGTFPPGEILALGLLTAFSGYTAIYALNDVVDHRVDREKMRLTGPSGPKQDLDSVFARHPLAQGVLTYREGLFWTLAWASLAAIGSYLLNPVCALIFLLACLLEFSYCRLLKVTHLRGIISGLVKTSGPLAAVFAVDPSPNPTFLFILFLWLFFWEIGGQNVPNDLADMEEDRRIGGKTIPVRLGSQGAVGIILTAIFLTAGLSLALPWVVSQKSTLTFLIGALAAGIYLLLIPAGKLFRSKDPQDAFLLFNRASYYPLAMLGVTVASWVF